MECRFDNERDECISKGLRYANSDTAKAKLVRAAACLNHTKSSALPCTEG